MEKGGGERNGILKIIILLSTAPFVFVQVKGESKSEAKESAAKQMMTQIGPFIEDSEWERSAAELRAALPEQFKVWA